MLNLLDCKKGDIVDYVQVAKPVPIALDGPLHWLIGITEPQRERRAAEGLLDLGLTPYLPVLHKHIPAGRRRKREIELAMFNCRVFVPLPADNAAWEQVRAVRGIRDFMRIDGRRPAVLADEAIDLIRRVEAKMDAKYLKRMAGAVESPYRKGRSVWAEIFPLQKMLGRIEQADAKGRIEILLDVEIFGRKVWPVEPHRLQFIDP